MARRTTTRRSTTRSSTTPLVAALVAALVVAAGFAVFGGGDGDGDASTFDLDAVAAATIAGPPVATGATGVPAPEVRAPALLSEGENEIPVAGEGTMVVFLAHWCGFCNAEVPVITRWLEEDGLPEGTEIRAVATGIDPAQPNFPPDTWLRERGWTVPTLIDADNSIANAYGVDGYPYWVFVDADGTVVGSGGPQDQSALVEVAESLAAG